MTIRSHESCDDDDVCFAFALPPAHHPPPSSPRLEATRAKLEERRAGILSASASTSAAVHRRHPRRRRSCGGDVHSGIESEYYCEQQQRQRHFEEGGLSVSLRRHSDPTTFEERRRVTFSAPLVTDVEYRPYTCPSERPLLFYSRAEIALFKAQKRSRRGGCTARDVSFPPGGNVVTEVWDPVPVERYEEEREMREGMYYTKEELHGFLQDFLKSLEDGAGDDDGDDGDDGERCEEDAPTKDSGEATAVDDAERVGESACATAFPADERFDDTFDDVPLDDGGGGAVPEGSGDDSDSDADSDDDEEGEDGGRGVPVAAAVWPAPPASRPKKTGTSVAAAVPDLLPPASPKCRRDVVDCGAAAPGMEQLPALPIMGC